MGKKSLFHASASLHCGAMLPPAFLLHGCSVFPAIGQPFLLVLRMGHVQTRLPAQKEAGLEFSCFWLGKRVAVKWPVGTTGPERVSGGMAAELCCIELALFCFG